MTESASRPLFAAARWSEMRSLLEELAEASAELRDARLEGIARQDAELASALRELLSEAPDVGTHAPDRIVERLAAQSVQDVPLRIGPFRLLHRIGAGGMGVIYLAEREQVDFIQQVALKLLDGGSARLARLAARERRILAGLTHPNITAFVDAGNVDGRAWLAMEYVDGEPLLDYCRRVRNDVHARVRLFDQVCAAVAHAHAQLVVHRDLKPSNILVTHDGTAKLLDFGIALMLDPGEDSEPATRVFTPEYAAPEQLRGERATTATDIYSLGLILYELVTGYRLPTIDARSDANGWSPTELARFATTREAMPDAPPRPQAETRALREMLRGDLGRIIAHALEPVPEQRYASATALREDIARWLDYRPLEIGRPGFGYVAGRFIRRHRAATALALVGLCSVLVLGSAALWQARAKTLEAARARAALEQSEATRRFMASLFFSADPIEGKGMKVTAAELLETARARIDAQLADQPDVAAELMYQIGNVYVSAGDATAVRETLGKALAYNARRVHPSAAIEVSATTRLAYLDYLDSHTPQNWQRLESEVARARAVRAEAPEGLAATLGMYGNALYNQERVEEAIAAERESAQIYQSLGPDHAPEYLAAMLVLSDLFASLDRHQDALTTADQALDHPYLKTDAGKELRNALLGERARGQAGMHRLRDAEATMAEVITQSSAALGFEHSTVRYWRYRRLQVLDLLGRLDEAGEEVGKLLRVPASNDEQPIAHIAHLVARLGIDLERRSPEASSDADSALAAACGQAGTALFCAKARLLQAEAAIGARPGAGAARLLDACGQDPAIKGNATLHRRLELLRARHARLDNQFDAARQILETVQTETGISEDERAQLDLERGYLALATHENASAITALESARKTLAADLSEPTPTIREIDSALASAGLAR